MVRGEEEPSLGDLSSGTPTGYVSDAGLPLRNRKRPPVRAGKFSGLHCHLAASSLQSWGRRPQNTRCHCSVGERALAQLRHHHQTRPDIL